MTEKSWFASWFDTPWYHLLYQNRSYEEAARFIHALIQELKPHAGASALDLACGKGRHSITLHQAGLLVTGVDLSPSSIAEASLSATHGLQFMVHDMRQPLNSKFDYIFNLFTSLGYFDTIDEDLQVMKSMAQMLESSGTAVIDFMNAERTIQQLVAEEEQIRGDISFSIQRAVTEDQVIVKSIAVHTPTGVYDFEERVRAYRLADFERMFQASGLTLVQTFGDYTLAPFQPSTSNRLIMILKHA